MTMTMIIFMLCCVSMVMGIEFLGESFTVLSNTGAGLTSSNRILVQCNSGDSATGSQKVVKINGTDDKERTAVITCRMPELKYLRTEIGRIPAASKVIVSETCSQFSTTDFNEKDTRRRGSGHDLRPEFVDGVRKSGTTMSRRSGTRRGLCFISCSSTSFDTTAIDAQILSMGLTLNQTVKDLETMLANQSALNAEVQEQFGGIDDRLFEFTKQQEAQDDLIAANKEYTIELKNVVDDINTRTEAHFIATDAELLGLSTRQAEIASNVARFASNTTSEFANVYDTIGGVANETNDAINTLRQMVVQWNKETLDNQIQTSRTIAKLSVSVRDARTERKFRNQAAELINGMASALNEQEFSVFADVLPVPRNDSDARSAITIETMHVTQVGSGIPGQTGRVIGSNSAIMYTFKIYSNREFLAIVSSTSLTWDQLLSYLGSGCTPGKCRYDSKSSSADLTECQITCNLWIEVSHSTCDLAVDDNNKAGWWKTKDPAAWQTSNGINNTFCSRDINSYYPESVVDGHIFNVDDWSSTRYKVCKGGGPGSETTVIAEVSKKVYTVPATDISVCEKGIAYAASQPVAGFDFVFVYLVERMASLFSRNLPDLDQIVHGRLPSGITTIRQDLATTPNGEIGRCMWNSVTMISQEEWIPVYAYTLVSADAGVSLELTVDDDEQDKVSVGDVVGLSGMSLTFPELYPSRFVGVGDQASMLNDNKVYDIPPSELRTGQALTREGTALYMFMSTAPSETNPVSAWEDQNGGTLFNHNAAVVSAERDLTSTVNRGGGKYECTDLARRSTEMSMCGRIADAGWFERRNNQNGEMYVTLRPEQASFALAVDIPSGKLIVQTSSECPGIRAEPVYGGGVRLYLDNIKREKEVKVYITNVGGCKFSRTLIVAGLGVSTVLMDPCVEEILVETSTTLCTEQPLNLVGVSARSLANVAEFDGMVDSAYVRTAVSTITDDVVLATTSVIVDTNSIISSLVDSLLKIVIENTNITVPPVDLERMANLSTALAENALNAVNNSMQLSTRPGYEKANTTLLDVAFTGLLDQMDSYSSSSADRLSNIQRLNAESVARRKTMGDRLVFIEESQKRFIGGFGKFGGELGKCLSSMAQAVAIVSETTGGGFDLGGFGDLLGGLGKAAADLGEGLGDAIVDVVEVVADVVVKAVDAGVGLIETAAGLAKDILNIPGALLSSLFMYSLLAVSIVNFVALCILCVFTCKGTPAGDKIASIASAAGSFAGGPGFAVARAVRNSRKRNDRQPARVQQQQWAAGSMRPPSTPRIGETDHIELEDIQTRPRSGTVLDPQNLPFLDNEDNDPENQLLSSSENEEGDHQETPLLPALDPINQTSPPL
jgi:hypothetical protein